MSQEFRFWRFEMKLFILFLTALGASAARYSLLPQFNDSAIIIDADKPLPLRPVAFPYYLPALNQPFLNNNTPKHELTTIPMSNDATVFKQIEFPNDLLEIAKHKLGLKTLDEIPSINELAELLGTNGEKETIAYIRQLTSTDHGIALMKAFMESTDYTNSAENKHIRIPTKAIPTTTAPPTQNLAPSGYLDYLAVYSNIYKMQPKHKQILEQQYKAFTAAPRTKPNTFKNIPPYHYPIPIRPLRVNRTGLRKPYGHPPHLNTSRLLNPNYIKQLARIANVSPEKLANVLQQKPNLVKLADEILSFTTVHGNNALAGNQLRVAAQKIMEQDEDLKKLILVDTLM